jgi:gluconate kinase
MPDYFFLYGLTGVGKSYCGKAIAQMLDVHFYDLDRDITDAMRRAIALEQPFPEAVRDEFFDVVCRRIAAVKAAHARCVFAQGAYRKKHRDLVQRVHPDVAFVMVDAPDNVVQERLRERGRGVSPHYAEILKAGFESPPPNALVLLNDGCMDAELERRFRGLIGQAD